MNSCVLHFPYYTATKEIDSGFLLFEFLYASFNPGKASAKEFRFLSEHFEFLFPGESPPERAKTGEEASSKTEASHIAKKVPPHPYNLLREED